MQEKALKMLKGLAREWQETNKSARARAGKSSTATTFLLAHVRLFRVSVTRGSAVCGLTVFSVGVHLLNETSVNIPYGNLWLENLLEDSRRQPRHNHP